MTPQRYNLIAVLGISPAILTETIYHLARRREPWKPASVHVVTTTTGAGFIDALLLGRERFYRGRTIEPAEARWEAFCEEVLGEPLPMPEPLIPERGGRSIEDVRDPDDDEALANLCYDTVERLTRDGLPLIGSIAGGRKTMSAHLMTAFSTYARPQDRLFHVLVQPPSYETERSFFYPTAETPDVELNLVDIRFPRLYRILREHLLPQLPNERRDLRAILDALEPINFERRPDRVRIEVGTQPRGKSELFLYDGEDHLDTCELSYGPLATLLVFAEHIKRGGGRVALEGLCKKPEVERQRRAIWELCAVFKEPAPWGDERDVSGDRFEIHKALEDTPIAYEHLTFETDLTTADESSYYYWKTEPPELELHIVQGRAPSAWPFRHLTYTEDRPLGR